MKTFFDLIQDNEFRDFVCKRIEINTQNPYSFPSKLPLLFRYRPLSTYAIDDIVNNKITMTSIGEFNDVFDGAIHQYGTMEEIEKVAEAKWSQMEMLRVAARLPAGILRRDAYVKPYIEHLKQESRLKFRELEYLGTYVCCFSKEYSSTLMWAHYADSNKGMCIEYDFNKLPSINGNLLGKSIFPIVYTTKPIDTADLMSDTGRQVYRYSFDAAILCAALNKSSIWQYEQEWRLVWVMASPSRNYQRVTINSLIMPSKVYFGYHFLRPFFYYDYQDEAEYQKCQANINKFFELIDFMQKNKIKASVMTPSIGSYQFTPSDLSTNELYGFMNNHFKAKEPNNIQYYYTVHDYLMDIIDKTQEDNHV